jgi:uncharacterized protein (DUF58 family)
VFVLVTLGVGGAAVNTGNNLLYLVLGLLLGLIVLSGVMSELVLRNVKVRRRLPQRAFAGSPCLIEISVENGKRRFPSLSVETEDVAESEPTDRRCYFLKVDAQSEQTASYQRTPARRGRLVLKEVRLRTRYPFGLFEKGRVLDVSEELLVYPALAPLPPTLGELGRAGVDATTPRLGRGVEIASLRELRDGDDLRAVHWRRSASLGRLVVRERHDDASRRLTLLVDERRPERADASWEERFERTLSLVASTAARALESDSSVEVVASSGRSPLVLPGQPADPIWRFLALLDPVPSTAAPPVAERSRGSVQRFDVEAATAIPGESIGGRQAAGRDPAVSRTDREAARSEGAA